MTYDEAVAELTKPGAGFQTTTTEIGGVEYTIFENVPPTLRDLFAGARLQGDKTFLVYEDERWSFEQVMAEVDGLGAALVDRYGVQKGDRVAIGMRNYPEWVIAYAAIVSIGAVSVSLNAWWTEDELAYALQDSGTTVLIADEERVERSRIAAERLGITTIGVRLGPDAAPPATDRWDDVVVAGTALPQVAIDPDDDATILYTSGTTGRPKGAVSTHRGVVQALLRLLLPDHGRVAPPTDRRRGPRPSAGVHPHRPPLPRDRERRGDAVVLHGRAEAGDHVQVGPRAGARADRARGGHQLRRRADPELGPAGVAPLRRLRHVEPHVGRRWWRPGPAPPRGPGGEELRAGRAEHRLRHDRDQRLRPAEQRRRLHRPPDEHRAGARRSCRSRSATRRARPCRSATPARSG